MPPKPSVVPSEREMDILKVLWHLGEVPVREVHAALSAAGPCAFTTVQTLLRIMAGKGLVRQKKKGRTLYYSSRYSSRHAGSRFLHKVFDGSMEQLVLNMLAAEDIPADELRRLERHIAAARCEKLNRESHT